MSDSIPKRSVIVAGHRTSVSLEEPFWEHLKRIAQSRSKSMNDLVTEIDAAPKGPGNFSSTLRLYVLANLEAQLAAAAVTGEKPISAAAA